MNDWSSRAYIVKLYNKDGLEVYGEPVHPEDFKALCEILGITEDGGLL